MRLAKTNCIQVLNIWWWVVKKNLHGVGKYSSTPVRSAPKLKGVANSMIHYAEDHHTLQTQHKDKAVIILLLLLSLSLSLSLFLTCY